MPLENRQIETFSGGSTDLNITHGSGNDRSVVAFASENHWDSANLAANATINGVNGTAFATSGGAPDGLRVRGWYWLDANLPASSGTYAVSIDGSDGNGRQLTCIYHTDAKQAAPADVNAFTLDYRGDAADTLTGDSGFCAVMASIWIYNSGNTVTLGGDQTSIFNADQNNALHTHSYNDTNGSMSHDFSAFELNGTIAFVIEPSAGGGGGGVSIPVIQNHRMRH